MSLISLLKKREVYSDFHKDLTLNPVSGDIARRINEDAIKESIKNLILTDRGERLFQPLVGSDIRKMLFENITPEVVLLIKEMVTDTLETYEPRCSLVGVDVLSSIDGNEISIIIVYNTINSPDPITLNVTLLS